LAKDTPCGIPYGLLKAGSVLMSKPRPEVHVTDLTGCLRRAYFSKVADYYEPPSQWIAAILGIFIHSKLEQFAPPGSDIELSLGATTLSGVKVVGTVDLLYKGEIRDTKCQPFGELVTMADGTEKRIEDIRILDKVLSWDGNHFVPSRVTAIVDGGVQPVYEVLLRSKQVIRVSENHPVLTDNGWVLAKDLDETVSITSLMSWTGTNVISDEDARLLGYLIGDGSTNHAYTVQFTNKEENIIDDMRQICKGKKWGFKSTQTANHLDRCGWYLTNRIDGTYTKENEPREKGRYFINKVSNVIAFTQEHGLHRKKSREKEIPIAIMTANENGIRNFIAAYFDCDGNITNPDTKDRIPPRLTISTASPILARQTSELLRRLGIHNFLYRTLIDNDLVSNYPFCTVCVWRSDAIQRFAEIIPFRHAEKRDRITRWIPELERRVQRRITSNKLYCIRKITNLGPMQTIGLEVENHHTYITSGIVTHNSKRYLTPAKLPGASNARQVNIYRWLLIENGYEAESATLEYLALRGSTRCQKCKCEVIQRDDKKWECPKCKKTWDEKKAHNGTYRVKVEMYPLDAIARWIDGRATLLDDALKLGTLAPKVDEKDNWLCNYCSFENECKAFDKLEKMGKEKPSDG